MRGMPGMLSQEELALSEMAGGFKGGPPMTEYSHKEGEVSMQQSIERPGTGAIAMGGNTRGVSYTQAPPSLERWEYVSTYQKQNLS